MATSAATPPNETRIYKTKIIWLHGNFTRIILQEGDGPCSLIAICNVFQLRNNPPLTLDRAEVSEGDLLNLVGCRLSESNKNINIADTVDLLPSLVKGIDVDLTFQSIHGFKPTPGSKIFGQLGIPLYHGWLVNPQDRNTARAIGSKSHEELELERSATGKLVENFLKGRDKQLTAHGLSRLKGDVKEGELCVLYGEKHLKTMYKHKGQLYLLASAEAKIDEHDQVWEIFNEVNGVGSYVDSNFEECKRDNCAGIDSATLAGGDTDSDLQFARQAHQEEEDLQTVRQIARAQQEEEDLGIARQIARAQQEEDDLQIARQIARAQQEKDDLELANKLM